MISFVAGEQYFINHSARCHGAVFNFSLLCRETGAQACGHRLNNDMKSESLTFSVFRRIIFAQVAVHLVPLIDKVDDHAGGLQVGQVVRATHADADIIGVTFNAVRL